MKNTSDNTGSEEKNDLPGYPIYPAGEDIYNRAQKELDIDPDDIAKLKESTTDALEGNNEKDFKDDLSGNDLDIPGSELDDSDELTGSEDEENNYYSLGGDEHNDLEEDKGE